MNESTSKQQHIFNNNKIQNNIPIIHLIIQEQNSIGRTSRTQRLLSRNVSLQWSNRYYCQFIISYYYYYYYYDDDDYCIVIVIVIIIIIHNLRRRSTSPSPPLLPPLVQALALALVNISIRIVIRHHYRLLNCDMHWRNMYSNYQIIMTIVPFYLFRRWRWPWQWGRCIILNIPANTNDACIITSAMHNLFFKWWIDKNWWWRRRRWRQWWRQQWGGGGTRIRYNWYVTPSVLLYCCYYC